MIGFFDTIVMLLLVEGGEEGEGHDDVDDAIGSSLI